MKPPQAFSGKVSGAVQGSQEGQSFRVRLIPVNVGFRGRKKITLAEDGSFFFSGVLPSVHYRVRVDGDAYVPTGSDVFYLQPATDAVDASSLQTEWVCSDDRLQCDVGTLRLAALGQMFAVDYAKINEGRRHLATPPYIPQVDVPLVVKTQQLLSDEESAGPAYTVQVRAMDARAYHSGATTSVDGGPGSPAAGSVAHGGRFFSRLKHRGVAHARCSRSRA